MYAQWMLSDKSSPVACHYHRTIELICMSTEKLLLILMLYFKLIPNLYMEQWICTLNAVIIILLCFDVVISTVAHTQTRVAYFIYIMLVILYIHVDNNV